MKYKASWNRILGSVLMCYFSCKVIKLIIWLYYVSKISLMSWKWPNMQSAVLNHPDWEIKIKAIWTEVGGPPLPALFFSKSSTLFYFSVLLHTQWLACVVLSYFLCLPTGNMFLILPFHSLWMRYLSNGLEGISSNLD